MAEAARTGGCSHGCSMRGDIDRVKLGEQWHSEKRGFTLYTLHSHPVKSTPLCLVSHSHLISTFPALALLLRLGKVEINNHRRHSQYNLQHNEDNDDDLQPLGVTAGHLVFQELQHVL